VNGQPDRVRQATVFLDLLALTFPDPHHSSGEEREIKIGHTAEHQVVFESHCQRGDHIQMFRDSESVNRALRLLVDTAEAAAGPVGAAGVERLTSACSRGGIDMRLVKRMKNLW